MPQNFDRLLEKESTVSLFTWLLDLGKRFCENHITIIYISRVLRLGSYHLVFMLVLIGQFINPGVVNTRIRKPLLKRCRIILQTIP